MLFLKKENIYQRYIIMMITKHTSFSLLVSRCLFIFAILFSSLHATPSYTKDQHQTTTVSRNAPGNKKKKKNIPNPPYPLKPFDRMNEKEITATVEYYTTYRSSDTFTLIKALERLTAIAIDHDHLEKGLLRLADLYYSYSANLEKAAATYKKYATLFPGTSKTEYAQYKSLICLFQSTLDEQHDQSTTQEAIDVAIDFIATTHNQTYKQEAQDIILACYDRLAQHEAEIARFYIVHNDQDAAQRRLEYIKTKLAHKAPCAKQLIEDLEKKLNPSPQPAPTTKKLSRKHKLLA